MRKTARFVGIISDTHGLLRTEALRVLKGTELICHAGDIGDPRVIVSLREIAPVVAVRGNNDRGPWARRFPVTAVAKVGNLRIYLLHDLKELRVDPRAKGYHAVISGHSHRPAVTEKEGVLYVNPGSAGPRRFTLPTTIARLEIDGERLRATIVPLAI